MQVGVGDRAQTLYFNFAFPTMGPVRIVRSMFKTAPYFVGLPPLLESAVPQTPRFILGVSAPQTPQKGSGRQTIPHRAQSVPDPLYFACPSSRVFIIQRPNRKHPNLIGPRTPERDGIGIG